MPKLTINNTEIEVAPGTSILQACKQLDIEVPHFCYHDKLSVAGCCRMCLVEVEKMPKPVASCAMPCADGMVVHTDGATSKRAQKSVMEMLLVNHPLDCPICDQGGECDLQDEAVAYGFDRGRYSEAKRAVQDKDLGPLVKTVMTRCIHCSRCVRFVDEICGTPELGLINRGEKTEVSTFVNKPLSTELSGNLIDICPVGALTNKPAAFTARSWEFQKTDSVDVFDAIGCNITIDVRDNEVMRVLPRLNDDINEEWVNDKTRFAIDGLKRQRLDRPYVRRNGKLQSATWNEAFAAIADKFRNTDPTRIAALAGDMVDCEAMFALKSLMHALGSPNLDCRQDGADYDVSTRAAYIMNSGIAGIEEADAILLIGTNPRHEGTLVNARIRKRWLRRGCEIGMIGAAVDLGYTYTQVGTSPESLAELASGKHAFATVLKNAKKPMIIVGAGALARADGAALHRAVRELAEQFAVVREDWNGFNVLQLAASRVGGLDLDFLPQVGGGGTRSILSGKMEAIWLLGADEIDTQNISNAFVVYQGHHGDVGAHRADVILPGAAYTEKSGIYVNTEGRSQMGIQAALPPGEAREDWKIIRAFSEHVGEALPFDNLEQLREKMFGFAPILAAMGQRNAAAWTAFGKTGGVSARPFATVIENFYMTDPISRASVTMAKCTTEILSLNAAEAAE